MKRYVALLFVVVAFCPALTWVNTGDLDSAQVVRDLAVGPNGHLYAAANRDTGPTSYTGGVYYSTDFLSWQRANPMPGGVEIITSLFKTTGDTLLAGTRAGGMPVLYHSADGTAWSSRSTVSGTRFGTAIAAMTEGNSGRLLVGGDYFGMYGCQPRYSDDRGLTWTPTSTYGYTGDVQFMFHASSGASFLGGTFGSKLRRTTDNGVNWRDTSAVPVNLSGNAKSAMAELSGARLFAGTRSGASGWIYRSTSNGDTWTMVYSGYAIRSLCAASDGNLYAGTITAALGAVVLVSSDGGASWNSAGTLDSASAICRLADINVSGTHYLYAATGPYGNVYRASLSGGGPIHDVGATKIEVPSGMIDSTQLVTPACSVYNFGTTTESYAVRMKIGAGYNQTAGVTNHAPAAWLFVPFPAAATWPRGNLAVSCSTELSGDAASANDRKTGTAFCRVLDAEVVSIAAPSGGVDSGASVIPQANVRNNGNTTVTFDVRFDITGGYSNVQAVSNLAPGATQLVSFLPWTASQRGMFTVKCSTMLTGDMVPANDVKTSNFQVGVHDVGVVAIVAPTGTIPPGAVTPQATVHNYGTAREAVDVTFMINSTPAYEQMINLPDGLPIGSDTTVSFPNWTATTPGAFVARCSTYLATDQVPANDVAWANFTVAATDVGALRVTGPSGAIDTSAAITPSAWVKNFGALVATFRVFFQINDGVTYSDSALVTGLASGDSVTVVFGEWLKPHVIGNYSTRCSTYLAFDANPANDTVSGAFIITAPGSETGWVRRADVLSGPRNRMVKDGGCLAYQSDLSDPLDLSDAGSIYALKGNATCEFYRYNLADNSWTTKESIPAVGRSGRKKPVKKGACLTGAEGGIYAAKGNSTLEFWSYNPSDRLDEGSSKAQELKSSRAQELKSSKAQELKSSRAQKLKSYPWVQMADVPMGARTVRQGAGATTVKLGETSYVYFLKGSSTREFYRYNTLRQLWESRADAPLGVSGRLFKDGSCITSDGANTIYALKGAYNEFFAYDVVGNTWTTRTGLPFIGSSGRKKKVGAGAGIAYAPGAALVYVLKGGNTQEFWMYRADSDRWVQKPDMPIGGGKKVKGGGGLVYAAQPNALFATKGNATLEFWKYGLAAVQSAKCKMQNAESSNVLGGAEVRTSTFALRTFPNPFSNATTVSYTLPEAENVSLKLYDVSGSLVTTLVNGYRDAGTSSFIVHLPAQAGRSSLSAGVYVLRLLAGQSASARKLIVE